MWLCRQVCITQDTSGYLSPPLVPCPHLFPSLDSVQVKSVSCGQQHTLVLSQQGVSMCECECECEFECVFLTLPCDGRIGECAVCTVRTSGFDRFIFHRFYIVADSHFKLCGAAHSHV